MEFALYGLSILVVICLVCVQCIWFLKDISPLSLSGTTPIIIFQFMGVVIRKIGYGYQKQSKEKFVNNPYNTFVGKSFIFSHPIKNGMEREKIKNSY